MLSLVIPVYRNSESIPQLLKAVAGLDRSLGGNFEAVFVVDGSPDDSYEQLCRCLPEQAFRSQLVLLSRNFGAFQAIRIGLQHGQGDFFAVMAADLQEPPELVLEMSQVLRNNEADVVVGVREARDDPFASRVMAQMFWSLYRRFVVSEMPPGGVDIFACNCEFRDNLLTLDERHSSLVAQVFWLGFRRKTVKYSRRAREYGKSAWTFRKKLNYLMDSVFAFTDLPIRVLTRAGGFGAALSMLFGLLVAILKLSGVVQVPGYAATILVITLLGSLNLFGLGIVGSYAWRTYENTKQRPLAIPMKVHVYEVEK